MEHIRVKVEDHYMHILLDRGKSNALDTLMVNELINAIDEAEDNPAIEGLIISGKQDFFSAGLDLITLYEYDELEIEKFWDRFIFLIQKLTAFPKPSIAAVTGHSPAGGCVLALCCDYRIMVEGEYVIGLNEVPVGLVVPASIFNLYAFWLGKGVAYRSLLEGKLFKPSEALQVGLVDEVVPFERIQSTAVKKLKSLTQFDQQAWRKSKFNFRKGLLASLDKSSVDDVAEVLIQWWRPTTRSILETLIRNLTNKNK